MNTENISKNDEDETTTVHTLQIYKEAVSSFKNNFCFPFMKYYICFSTNTRFIS